MKKKGVIIISFLLAFSFLIASLVLTYNSKECGTGLCRGSALDLINYFWKREARVCLSVCVKTTKTGWPWSVWVKEESSGKTGVIRSRFYPEDLAADFILYYLLATPFALLIIKRKDEKI